MTFINVFPGDRYPVVSALAFKITFSISAVYTVGKVVIDIQDLLMIAAIVVLSIVGVIIIYPIVFLHPKQDRFLAFA